MLREGGSERKRGDCESGPEGGRLKASRKNLSPLTNESPLKNSYGDGRGGLAVTTLAGFGQEAAQQKEALIRRMGS